MRKTKKMLISTSIFIILTFFVVTNSSSQTWEEKLNVQFDIVETFDSLNDWKGSNNGNIGIETYPNDFPQKNGGAASIWQYYAYYGPLPALTDWIADHGAENVWKGSGKSLIIDYNEGGAVLTNFGPSNFGFKIGNSPSDGYPDEVHVFYMTKWFKNFFKYTGNDFNYHRFVKTLDISAGFKTIRLWGTDSERAWLQGNCQPPYPKTQVLNHYGMNAQVYNFTTGISLANKEVVKNTVLYSQQSGEAQSFCHYNGSQVHNLANAEVGQPILSDSWFGLEYRVKTSKPHGTANGEFETWIYDSSGSIIAHELTSGIINFKDGNTVFNHSWNKFIWGGNRYDNSYCGASGPGCDFGETEHFFVDDVIVNASRVGSKYFKMLTGDDTTPPKAPTGLKIR